jgi:5-methylthioadenosine/S-adenosylhomocysteine deaminase
MKIKIQNALLLTMADGDQLRQNTDIYIEDQKIVSIGNAPDGFIADELIDADNHLVMPGLVNAHTHIGMSLLRNYADDLPFWPWLTEKIWPIEDKLTANDVYWGSMLSIAEMIRSGVTSFADMYFFMDDVAKAVETTGIRANLARGMVGNAEVGAQKLAESLTFKNEWHGKADGRIQVDLAPHAPYSCEKPFLEHLIKTNEVEKCRMHIHLSESSKEVADSIESLGMSPIAYVDSLGLFEYPTIAAHCVHLSDEDIAILAKKKVNVIHNPGSNLKLGNGFAPIKKMLEAGVNVALGTDGSSSNNNLNLFEEMNLVATVHKAVHEDPTLVPAYTALEMATVNGAKALGLEGCIGQIKEGYLADLIMIDLKKPHFYPRFNMTASLVYSAQASDVKDVMVYGKWVMRNYELLTMNEQEVCEKANACALNLIGGAYVK